MKILNKEYIITFAMIGGVALFIYIMSIMGNKKVEAEQQQLEIDKKVAVLPIGTEEAWLTYIDTRISNILIKNGNVLQLNDDLHRSMRKISYVSLNTPYKIDCKLDTTTIEFGSSASEDSGTDDSVEIFNSYQTTDSTNNTMPKLGVNEESIAATKLQEHVCQHIAEKVQSILRIN